MSTATDRKIGAAPHIGLLYPTRDCGEDDFTALAALLDPAIAVEFCHVRWGDTVDRLEDLDTEGRRSAVRELGEVDRLTHRGRAVLATARRGELDVLELQLPLGPSRSTCPSRRARRSHRQQSQQYLAGVHRGRPAAGPVPGRLASVYHHDVTEAFIDFLAAAGTATVQHASLDAPSDRALAACRPGQIFDIAQAADTTDAEMMLIPETALHTTALLAELEARLRKPVLTATQVTVWHSLSLLGRAYSHRDLGALFRP
jgi:hypothetical protein